MLTFNTRDVYVENFVETVENPAAAPFLRILGICGRNFFRLFPRQKGIKQIICRLHPACGRGMGRAISFPSWEKKWQKKSTFKGLAAP